MGRPAKFTRADLIRALISAKGNYVVAAVLLEVNPSTVYRAIERYAVRDEEWRPAAA